MQVRVVKKLPPTEATLHAPSKERQMCLFKRNSSCSGTIYALCQVFVVSVRVLALGHAPDILKHCGKKPTHQWFALILKFDGVHIS